MGKGFLGTSASFMLDFVVVSLVAVVPLLLFSLYLVKIKKSYSLHKKLQIFLSIALGGVVGLFEVDMRLQGGFWAMAKNSPYAESDFLHRLLTVHLCFSISTVIFWAVTLFAALKFIPAPPGPSRFSPTHKIMAWITIADLVGTVVTGLMVYYYGFWIS